MNKHGKSFTPTYNDKKLQSYMTEIRTSGILNDCILVLYSRDGRFVLSPEEVAALTTLAFI